MSHPEAELRDRMYGGEAYRFGDPPGRARAVHRRRRGSQRRVAGTLILEAFTPAQLGRPSSARVQLCVIGMCFGWLRTRSSQRPIAGKRPSSKRPSSATCVYAYSAMSAIE